MSVTIRKKEEPRNTPLLNFLLIACVPVLLAFLGGISTGKSSGMNIKEYEAKLEDAEKQLNVVSEELRLLSELNIKLDSLSTAFKDEMLALERDLSPALDAAESDAGTLYAQWKGKKNELIESWQTKIGSLRRTALEQVGEQTRPAVEKSINLFQDYQLMANERMSNSIKFQESLRTEGQVDALQQAKADLAEQEQQLEMKTKMISKDNEISDLKAELAQCKKAGGTDNSPAKKQIEDTVQSIQGEVIPSIPSGIFNSKGDKVKDLLNAKLTAINVALQKIK